MRYEIDKDTLAVSVYQDGAQEPFIFQPHFPDGTPFVNNTEAEKLAQAILAHHKNGSPFPISPDELHNKKPATIISEDTSQIIDSPAGE